MIRGLAPREKTGVGWRSRRPREALENRAIQGESRGAASMLRIARLVKTSQAGGAGRDAVMGGGGAVLKKPPHRTSDRLHGVLNESVGLTGRMKVLECQWKRGGQGIQKNFKVQPGNIGLNRRNP